MTIPLRVAIRIYLELLDTSLLANWFIHFDYD